MPWYFPWSEAIKKRACRYLLQRYLGQFLQEKLSLDQLTVDLYSGKGIVTDVLLDVDLINETFEAANLSFEIVDGFIASVSVEIPWSALLSENTHVEIQGLEVTLKPKQVAEKSAMLDSMWGSMTKSSMQLAEELLKEEERNKRTLSDESERRFEGLEKFAQAIDIVLTRIRVDFTDITIRLEQVQDDTKSRSVAIEVRIKRVGYFDEAAEDVGTGNEQTTYIPSTVANKCFHVEGVTIFSDEYASVPRPVDRLNSNTSVSSVASSRTDTSELFYSAIDLSGAGQLEPRTEQPVMDEPVPTTSVPRLASGNLVQIAVCHGLSEIRLKVKQNNDVAGPKFELDGHLGILHILLWPKQLQMLRDLFGQIWKGRAQSIKNKSNEEMHKQMTPSDYSKIETELQRDLDDRGKQLCGGNSVQRSTWDTRNLDEEEFFPVGLRPTQVEAGIGEKGFAAPSSGFQSSSMSVVNIAKLKVKSFFLTLIESDPASAGRSSTFPFSELQKFSTEHFEALSGIETWDLQDTLLLRDRFAKSLPQGHVWFSGTTAIFEATEKQSSSSSSLSIKATMAGMEVWEHLFDAHQPDPVSKPDDLYRLRTVPLCTELLTFPTRTIDDRYSYAPCVVVQFDLSEMIIPNARQNSPLPTKKSLKVILQAIKTDIDITIIDRLHALLSVLAEPPKPVHDLRHNPWRDAAFERASADSSFDCSFSCSNVTAQIRFPVLDLRPAIQRTPWFTRSLQKESVVVDMTGFVLSTKLDSETSKRLDFVCESLTASLQLSPDDVKPLTFLRAVMDIDTSFEEFRRQEFANRPKMSIYLRNFSPKIGTTDILLGPNRRKSSSGGSLEALIDSTEKDPSLFSVQKNMVEHEEINCVVPSPLVETTTFKENIVGNCKMVIEINIPSVTAFVLDKDALEILYNRKTFEWINTDLLLWEPSAPRMQSDTAAPLSAAHLIGKEFRRPSEETNTFEICRSTPGDDDGDSGESDNEYYARENLSKNRTGRLKAMGLSSYRSKIPSDVCLICNIEKAGMGAKVENPIPDKLLRTYEAWIELDDFKIFSVSGYRGQPEIKYSTISVDRFSLFFGDYVEPSIPKTDRLAEVLQRPSHLVPIAVPLPDGMQVSDSASDMAAQMHPMLNMAVEINVDTFRNVKDIKVALEFNAVKLSHRMTTPEEFWLTQMIDFINLKDFPVVGYSCPTIITEFHLNLTSSLLEYRPKRLPVRAAVTVEKMNVSSTIVADSPQSLMRVITQDLRVHLSKKKQPVVLRSDYICVVDIPFLEFQMKLTDGLNPKFPRFDFRASNNCCYLRTCSDSCHALSELIVYLANDGDLVDGTPVPAAGKVDTSTAEGIVKSMEEHVNDEMLDAMKESPPRKDSLHKTASRSTHPAPQPHYRVPMAASITASVIRPFDVSDEDDINYDEYCVIEEDLGVGIAAKGGEPTVKFLSSSPIQIIENYFSLPSTTTDQLKAPDGFPVPTIRLALREMSLIWCLYGGRDFDEKGHTPRKLGSHNRLQSAPAKLGEARSSSNKPEKSEHAARSPSWLRQGGSGRDHAVLMEIHLNKVKFQHEAYPFDGKSPHAARQILFIQEFEIRDRMATSEINKFLYQYVSANLPKQSHKHMFSVRALHERPDPSLPMQECTLKISLQPLRLNVDQESLFFLSDFFAEASDPEKVERDRSRVGSDKVTSTVSSDQLPMKTRRLESLEEEGPPLQSPLIQFEDTPSANPADLSGPVMSNSNSSALEKDSPIFFKSVTFSPEVPIRLDYFGKYVDVERVGALGGLLVGLAQLNCSMLKLSRINNRQGIRGFDRLILQMVTEWITDIRKNQLASLLGGVGPMHCLVQLVQGVRDLFWLPVEQYRKDGRIVRGVQRGASAFTTSTLIATIELTNKLVHTVQIAAESAYDVISPGPSFRRKKRKSMSTFPRAQPGDIREGIVTAYQVLSEGFSDTAREVVEAVTEEREHKGMTGAVGASLRQVGPVLVKPLILASQATSNVLGGLRNQLQPDFRQDEIEKWRTEDDVKKVTNPR